MFDSNCLKIDECLMGMIKISIVQTELFRGSSPRLPNTSRDEDLSQTNGIISSDHCDEEDGKP